MSQPLTAVRSVAMATCLDIERNSIDPFERLVIACIYNTVVQKLNLSNFWNNLVKMNRLLPRDVILAHRTHNVLCVRCSARIRPTGERGISLPHCGCGPHVIHDVEVSAPRCRPPPPPHYFFLSSTTGRPLCVAAERSCCRPMNQFIQLIIIGMQPGIKSRGS